MKSEKSNPAEEETVTDSERIVLWFIIGSLQIGGTNRTLVDLVNNIDTERYEVTIWTLLDPGVLAEEVTDQVAVRSLHATGKYDLRAPIRFALLVRKHRPDILQSFLFFDNVIARLCSPLSPNTSLICGVRAVPNEPNRLRKLVDRATIPLADAVVSNSAAGADLAVERGANPENVSVIHNGRDIDAYTNGAEGDDVRAELGIEDNAQIIGTVGRLIYRKGHHDLIHAFHRVHASRPSTRLLLVGDGPQRGPLEALVNELDIDNAVIFAGARTDVPRLLDAIDIFAFPSHFEGLPGALQEAMIAGLPIVTTPVDGNKELVTHSETGLYVEPASHDSIARALERLLDDPTLANRIANHAATDARERFAVDRMVEEFEDLYCTVRS